MSVFRNQPLFVLLFGIMSLLMYVPVLFSVRLDQWLYARTFFYHGTFFLIISVLLGIAFSSQKLQKKIVQNIFDLFCCFVFLPIFMAIPLNYLIINIDFFDAYFEMLSSFTTTGASIFDDSTKIPDVLHLWRALIAWVGGLLMLVAALAIFQPAGLGGFDVYARKNNSSNLKNQIKSANIRLINDPTLTTLMSPLNIDASVNPRATTVSSILRHVRHGRVKAVYSIGDAEAEVIEAQVMSTSPIVGSMIKDVEWPNGSIIGSIQKNSEIFRPKGSTKIEEGDIVVIFTLSQDVSEVERLFQVNIDFF